MSLSQLNSNRNGSSSSVPKTKSTGKTTPQTRSDKAKSTKSYPKGANFVQKLNDGSVYQYGYKDPDGNRTPADAEADNEDEVKDLVLPVILTAIGAIDGAKKNVWFNNFEHIVEGISHAKPDYYYGAHLKQLDQRVRNDEELSNHIIPSTTTSLPILPNFFLEAKGPQGSTAEALRQACHDSAIGARAMHSLQSYGEKQPVYDNNTYAISSTYHTGTLKIYGHSVAQPRGPGTQPEYSMNQIKGYSMTSDRDTFIQGATAFKNALKMTKGHRDAAIARANGIAARTVEDDSGDRDDNDNDDDDEDDDDNEGEETDNDETETMPSNGLHSFIARASSRQAEDEEAESETSVEGPPAKRHSSSKIHQSLRHRQKGKGRKRL